MGLFYRSELQRFFNARKLTQYNFRYNQSNLFIKT